MQDEVEKTERGKKGLYSQHVYQKRQDERPVPFPRIDKVNHLKTVNKIIATHSEVDEGKERLDKWLVTSIHII